MSNESQTTAQSVVAALALRAEPLAASTADGEIRAHELPLADRLAAVRGTSAGDGSCSFTGWGS